MKPRKLLDGPDGAVLVPLTKGAVAAIDPEDAGWVGLNSWCLASGGYALRRVGVLMHREVLIRSGYDLTGLECDHIDGNTLNNRRSNLRPATHMENMWNQGPRRNNRLSIKGVMECRGKFKVQIYVDGRPIYLGYYDTPEEASAVYKAAAVKHFGEFANIERY